MAKKINLDIASVEQREQRLGTIIAWDGTTEDLHKASNYEVRGQRDRGTGCAGNCRLCELQGPFTQGSVCSDFQRVWFACSQPSVSERSPSFSVLMKYPSGAGMR